MSDIEERREALRERLRALPSEQESAERIAGLAEVRVTGVSADGMVTVRADGRGKVLGVDFDPRALRGHDNEALAEQVKQALNRAFDAAERQQRDGMSSPDPDELARGLDAIVDGFGRRMDGLTARLDQIAGEL